MKLSLLTCFCALIVVTNCQEEITEMPNVTNSSDKAELLREKKVFSFFQVFNFPNDVCVGENRRNGTCYTTEECLGKGGTSTVTCASGYGVCCIFLPACGSINSENNSFLYMRATLTPTPSTCVYNLCPINSNICRIRLDFIIFAINGPQTGSSVNNTAFTESQSGGALGDCISDAFTLTTPNNRGSPVICGINIGQHMIIDASSQGCAKATFNFGTSAYSRAYDIKVSQYSCGDEMGGPPDCLQFFTSNTGTVSSYNFALTAGKVGPTTTHLSNQLYNICFRRNSGKCAICFIPQFSRTTSISYNYDQTSFGLSNPSIAAPPPPVTTPPTPPTPPSALSVVESECIFDFLRIPNAAPIATVNTLFTAPIIAPYPSTRFCGRVLSTTTGTSLTNLPTSVCTGMRPFKITFQTDANEETRAIPGIGTAPPTTSTLLNEQHSDPGGIIGFSLNYMQISC